MNRIVAARYLRSKGDEPRSIDLIWGMAYGRGLEKHGIQVEDRAFPNPGDRVEHADFHFCWSFKHRALLAHCRATGEPLVVLEHGYTADRRAKGRAKMENQQNVATSVNLNGLNGENQIDMSCYARDSSRCEKYGWHITPRETLGNETIVIGQVTGDRSLNGLPRRSIYGWAADKIAVLALAGHAGNIFFKPHPLEDKDLIQDVGAPVLQADMNEILTRAGLIVTFSSTAAVDAWLNGIPATADSPVSMIYAYQHRADIVESRQEWLHVLSYLQFKMDEMKSGFAWEIHGQQVLQSRPALIS